MIWLGLAAAAAAEPAAPFLSIAVGDAPPITAPADDILSVERAPGHDGKSGLMLRLSPRFDAAMARMTAGRDGQIVTMRLCGQVLLRSTLRGTLPSALFTLSLRDDATQRRVEAALDRRSCDDFPSS